jgi:hypothetical protein
MIRISRISRISMKGENSHMNLAQLIHRALGDPELRLALESGHINMAGYSLSASEVAAASEVMRCHKGPSTEKLLGGVFGLRVLPTWREDH